MLHPVLGDVFLLGMWQWFDGFLPNSVQVKLEDFLPHILVAIALGIAIGFERRHRHKVAGVRTHMIMSASACIITLCGVYMHNISPNADPTRLAGQILSGIGFVGAGVILRHGFTTSGVTTAATVLLVAGIGMCAGFGFFTMAITTTIIMLIALVITHKYLPANSSEMGGHSLLVRCPLDKFVEVKNLFAGDTRIDLFRKEPTFCEFRIHTDLTAEQVTTMIASVSSNPSIMSIEVVEDPS
jgi:uncharacterized membrane protein YhiD involved in acid resistance